MLKEVLMDCFFFYENSSGLILQVVLSKMKLCQTNNQQKNYTNLLLENLKNEKYIHFYILEMLKTILGMLICRYAIDQYINKGFRFFFFFDIFRKYTWIVPLKEKKGMTNTNTFRQNLGQSNQKAKKYKQKKTVNFTISQQNHGYNTLIQTFIQHNERKFVVAEKFISTFKNKIYKYMASISRNLCIDKLADIVNEYNSIYHRTIEINSADIMSVLNVF